MSATPLNIGDLNEEQHTMEIEIAGEKVTVNRSDKIRPTLVALLKARNLDSYTLIVDGDEILDPATELPDLFDDVETVVVNRYAKPGILG